MSAVEIFRAPTGQDIRGILRDGEPWMVAADICAALAIGNPSDAVRSLDDDEYELVPAALVSGEGRPQDYLNIVNEAGLYSLILRSRKPEAKAFKRWITHEVLPAIRRTGTYAVAGPAELDELEAARRYVKAIEDKRAAVARALAAEAHAAALEPAARAWDVLASANGDYSVREAAYALNRDPQIAIGQNRLFAWLRENGWLDRNSIPYATHAAHVTLRVYSFTDKDGEERTAQQVRVTVAGLRLLHRRLGGIAPLQLTVPADVEVAA